MQTIEQKKALKEFVELTEEEQKQLIRKYRRNGRNCRHEDTDSDRACFHNDTGEPGGTLLAAAIGGGVVILILISMGVIP